MWRKWTSSEPRLQEALSNSPVFWKHATSTNRSPGEPVEELETSHQMASYTSLSPADAAVGIWCMRTDKPSQAQPSLAEISSWPIDSIIINGWDFFLLVWMLWWFVKTIVNWHSVPLDEFFMVKEARSSQKLHCKSGYINKKQNFEHLAEVVQRRQWQTTLVLLPGKSHGWRSLVGCSPWGCKELDTTEQLHFHFSLSCIGEGNGNPLQCSCLENPRDRGAWWSAVYGVAQSRTRLTWLGSSSSSWSYYLFTKSCQTLWDSMDWSPPGSLVHGISQARTPEWVSISYSRGSSPRDQTWVSCIDGQILYHWVTRAACLAEEDLLNNITFFILSPSMLTINHVVSRYLVLKYKHLISGNQIRPHPCRNLGCGPFIIYKVLSQPLVH